MGRKSTVKQLDPRIRQAVDRLVRDNETLEAVFEVRAGRRMLALKTFYVRGR